MKRLAALLVVFLAAGPAAAGPRVMSLDQCADQYVLALARPQDIVGLSRRADDADSYLRDALPAHAPLRRVNLESALAARPEVVVRYWGGDELMARRLRARGVKVVRIEEAGDFAAVRANVRRVAAALADPAGGERLIARMDAELSGAAGAWAGRRALYLTPGGFTAGAGTLVGAMLRAAGLVPAAARAGYAPVPLERLVLDPPAALVLGFFDRASAQSQWWSQGRTAPARRLARGRTLASLPGAVLGCPAWFSADGAAMLAARRSSSLRGARPPKAAEGADGRPPRPPTPLTGLADPPPRGGRS